MANISRDDCKIIAEHPLENSLDHLRDVLRKAEQSYESGNFKAPDYFDAHVAFYLHSKIGNRDVTNELLTLRKRVQKGDFNYGHNRALSRLVIKEAPDVNIWNTVFNLSTTISWISSPASIDPSFNGTPITHSSSSQQSSEQIKELLNGPIFHKIKKCIYRNVGGFFSKYFEGKERIKRSKEIYNAVKDQHIDCQWTDFPNSLAQNAVWEWLVRFQDEFLFDAQSMYYTSRSTKDLTGVKPDVSSISLSHGAAAW